MRVESTGWTLGWFLLLLLLFFFFAIDNKTSVNVLASTSLLMCPSTARSRNAGSKDEYLQIWRTLKFPPNSHCFQTQSFR